MKDTKEILQKARQSWLLAEIEKRRIEYPNAEISKKTGYSDAIVSMYLTNKRAISVSFMKAFCEAYNIDFDDVNHTLIERIKQQVSNPEGGGKRVTLPVNTGIETNNPELKSESLTKVNTDENQEGKVSQHSDSQLLSQLTPNTQSMESQLLLQLSMKMADNEAGYQQIIKDLLKKIPDSATPSMPSISVNRGKAQVVKEK